MKAVSYLLVLSFLHLSPWVFAQKGIQDMSAVEDDHRIVTLYFTGGVSLSDAQSALRAMAPYDGRQQGLVLLGDAIYPGETEKKKAVDQLRDVVKEMEKTFSTLFIVPGEKEWRLDKTASSSTLQSLDQITKDVKNKGRLIAPAKDCGLPVPIRINEHTILVLMDSQWAIESASQIGEKFPGCELANVLELRLALKDILKEYPDDHILIAAHHPVYSNGKTAGHYPLSSHLLPLPVLGSMITAVKSMVSSNQFFSHPAYEAFRSAMELALDGCTRCVYISSHENNLQYVPHEGVDYFVVGAGEPAAFVAKAHQDGFTSKTSGWLQVDCHASGELHFQLRSNNPASNEPVIWRRAKALLSSETPESIPDINTALAGRTTIRLPASEEYAEKKFLRGEFYRREWSTPVEMKILWLDSVAGGLKPVQLGGGNQTRSLRLENSKGEQFVLRSIDKKVTTVLPRSLRGTFAENIVQDGIAASHPYGALAIPQLAKAAGIYYTNPEVVYVPAQPALGKYLDDIADGVYVFEERPGGTTDDFENFGNTEKTYNTADVIELLSESSKYRVDQRAVLRARLIDNWLGDWDRHDDQWRWASFEEGGQKVLRPIPRDRDQVFFKNDGVLDYLASRPYFNPALRKFDDHIDHLGGLIWAAKYFDRSFLHTLGEEDFITVATELKTRLTNDVIRAALRDMPDEIESFENARIEAALKQRRDDLPEMAKAFYRLISDDVFIPATVHSDLIEISGAGAHQVRVVVTMQEKKGKEYILFDRIFDDRVTDELRIFGLAGEDRFVLRDVNSFSSRIRIIGGGGDDVLDNLSSRARAIAYDDPEGMLLTGMRTRHRLNDHPLTNSFNRKDWNMDRSFFFFVPTYFTDEGLGLTGTYWLLKHGFRAIPFKSKHSASLSYFFSTGSFIGQYQGEWRNAIGPFDLSLLSFVTGPTFTQYWFGFGNEYIDYDEKRTYHIVSGSQVRLEPSLRYRFGFGSTVSLTPMYQFVNIENETTEETRFIYTPASGLVADDFGQRHYAGAGVTYQYERIDNAAYPSRGLLARLSVGYRSSLQGEEVEHGWVAFESSFYLPFTITESVVLASHIGYDQIFGDYEFFHAMTLGGQNRVRGFFRDRFAGDRRYYHATDLRVRLINSRGAVPFQLGLYGSFDYGRVWREVDVASADRWHTSVGGGVFIAPFGMTAFRIGMMKGRDDLQLVLGGRLGF